MRVPWIRVHGGLYDKPVVDRLARATHINEHEAIGVLVTFWSGVSQYATDGCVAGVSDAQIEKWARWRRKRGAFAAWVRQYHLDDNGRVREWAEYAGELEFQRERNRLNQATSRERRKRALETLRLRHETGVQNGERNNNADDSHGDVSAKNGDGHGDVTVTSPTTRRDETRRDETRVVHEQKQKRGARAPDPPWVDEAVTIWRASVGHTTPTKMRRALAALVAEHEWDRVRPALEVYVSPDEGPPADKPRRPEWFAENFHRWRQVADMPLEDGQGVLTERGRRLLARAPA